MVIDPEEGMDRLPPPLSSRDYKIGYGADDDRLHNFYIPALECSIRLDRCAGFFSSAALSIAATGITRLIHNGGKMRILCGAELSEDDVEAIRKGEDLQDIVGSAMSSSLEVTEELMRKRLEALAWMVANDKLEIRVVIPKDEDGLPRPATESQEYYHPKEGVFEDAFGNKLGFSGSVNESENGWQKNYEVFSVYTSWPRTIGADEIPPLPQFITGIEKRFNLLWTGKQDDWIALDIPQAAREKLLKYRPSQAPPRLDPLENQPEFGAVLTPESLKQKEAILFRFLKDAPFLPNVPGLGTATSAVTPWPHQSRIVEEAISSYPRSYMFCDEVGLGKTIEVGLVLRQLLISGRVERVLLLVPKSVQKQWQEELYEKFILNVPRYASGSVLDVFGNELEYSRTDNLWNQFPILLASSQLVKRRDRQAELLSADPWDLLIVDEAHHARRKDFLQDIYRPNRLLELLTGGSSHEGIRNKTDCIYLLTATPMQVHPIEVWDLLKIVGLGGMWGASKENYLRFFEELREPITQRDWDFLMDMVRDYLESGGNVGKALSDTAEDRIGLVDWETIKSLPYSDNRKSAIAQLPESTHPILHEFTRIHTPIHSLVWRSTRDLLRKYREKGILKANVPKRIPRNQWIDLREGAGSEREIYERVEEYISDFYRKYESERKGLGFVMTVYRRRLTSSFYALERSLERRQKFLMGAAGLDSIVTDDDMEQDELDFDISELLEDAQMNMFKDELVYVDSFLRDLRDLPGDSKLEYLLDDLRYFFTKRDKVIIFTQYTDTMDYLRSQLSPVYGSQIACYSGRGGEKWDGVSWLPVTKEQVKREFKEGEDLKILLCTESASEGLNLQTCGILINYDMPWNPMRVEQRIGRIDRIGQIYDDVWIRNYFYSDTVEARVYQRLEDRIVWFEEVVGELQPILYKVATIIQRASMLTGDERKKLLDLEIYDIRRQIEERKSDAFSLDTFVDDQVKESTSPDGLPISLNHLEVFLTKESSLRARFSSHPDIHDAYLFDWNGEQHWVTFKPSIFDEHPYSVRMLTYGDTLFDSILVELGSPEISINPSHLASVNSLSTPIRAFYSRSEGNVAQISDFDTISTAMESKSSRFTSEHLQEIMQDFRESERERTEQLRSITLEQQKGKLLALEEEARMILRLTAYVDTAESQFLDSENDYPLLLGEESVTALARYGIPFKGLLVITEATSISLSTSDSDYIATQSLSRSRLSQRKKELIDRGTVVLRKYSQLKPSNCIDTKDEDSSSQVIWMADPSFHAEQEVQMTKDIDVIKAAIKAFGELTRGNSILENEGMTWAQLITNFSTRFPESMDPKLKRNFANEHLKEALNHHYGKDNWISRKLSKIKGEGKTAWIFVKDTPGYEWYLKDRERRHAE